MININELIQISEKVEREDIANEIKILSHKLDQAEKEIIVPLVGEFSSGKTSILNSLTDSKNLETASKATTATIFEIRFGRDQYSAVMVSESQDSREFSFEKELLNVELKDAQVIRIFDTSTKVPSSTVLVDTPGLSSNDVRHKIALTSYLPVSDAIFLVVDINQQVTKTLIDFVEDSKLSQKPIYLIINKCDTKTPSEIEAVKNYFHKNINISADFIACISTINGNQKELFDILDHIQKEKNNIVNNSIKIRVNSIAENLSNYIDELLRNLGSDKSFEKQIDDLDFSLRRTKSNIDRLLKDASERIENKSTQNVNVFKKRVAEKLDPIVQKADCDAEVYEAVNVTAHNVLNNYKKDIQSEISKLAKERKSKLDAVPLQTLEALDLSNLAFNDFSHNMNLSEMGHKYDKAIGYAAVGVVAAAAIYYIGGGAIVGFVKNTVKNPATRELALKSVMNGNFSAINNKINATQQEIVKIKEEKVPNEDDIKAKENEISELRKIIAHIEDAGNAHSAIDKKRGFLETSVGFITDKLLGKPQRKRAISNYIDNTLLPDFKVQMDTMRDDLVRLVDALLNEEASIVTTQMEETLKNLQSEKENATQVYENRVAELKQFQTILNNQLN